MTLEKVDKYMPEGVRALSNLLTMLLEAATACDVPVKKVATWNYMGLNFDGGKFWAGVNLLEPGKLWFETRCQIDHEVAAKLRVGPLCEQNGLPGRYQWYQEVELDSESIHFFSHSKVGQLEWLEKFLRECLKQARSIQTLDQPAIPGVPEEGI